MCVCVCVCVCVFVRRETGRLGEAEGKRGWWLDLPVIKATECVALSVS